MCPSLRLCEYARVSVNYLCVYFWLFAWFPAPPTGVLLACANSSVRKQGAGAGIREHGAGGSEQGAGGRDQETPTVGLEPTTRKVKGLALCRLS